MVVSSAERRCQILGTVFYIVGTKMTGNNLLQAASPVQINLKASDEKQLI